MFERVAKALGEQLNVDISQIKPESRLIEDLKADSANVMMLVMDLENEYNITIPDEAFGQIQSVGDVVRFIEEAQGK